MIVRIMGEGQFDVAEASVEHLNELDAAVEAAVESGDLARFSEVFGDLLDGVRRVGTPHPADALDESDLILPPADASIDDVRALLTGDGLIPG